MISIRELSVRRGTFTLHEMSLEVGRGEYLVVVGPTGAGKTILLEAIAGLDRAHHGEILMDGENVTRLPPEKRGLGYVPQDYALFPFLDVAGNITFGLKGRRGRL